MKKMRKREDLVLVIMMLFGSINPVFAKTGDAGAAGAYLRMGVGARPLAMGGSFVAISDDAYATYWNPGGLTQLNSRQIGSMYAVMSADRRHSFLNYGQPLSKNWALGINWLGFGIDDIERRDSSGNLIEKLKDSENSYYFSLAKRYNSSLSLGANLKTLTHQLAGKGANGFGFDIGALLKAKNNLSLGFILQDIGSSLKWNTESKHKDEVPLNIRIGGALRLFEEKLLLACDLEKNETQSIKLHLGGEYLITKALVLRAGYDDGELTAGAGFKFLFFSLDYGFSTDKVKEGNPHILSLMARF